MASVDKKNREIRKKIQDYLNLRDVAETLQNQEEGRH